MPRAKLARKGCDWIVANDVSAGGPASWAATATRVHLVTADGVETWPTLDKDEVAAPPRRAHRASLGAAMRR